MIMIMDNEIPKYGKHKLVNFTTFLGWVTSLVTFQL